MTEHSVAAGTIRQIDCTRDELTRRAALLFQAFESIQVTVQPVNGRTQGAEAAHNGCANPTGRARHHCVSSAEQHQITVRNETPWAPTKWSARLAPVPGAP